MHAMRIIGLFAVFTVLAGTASALLPNPNQESHVHIGHVLDAWEDTPDQMGLLPVAQAEAAIALEHIALALAAKDLKEIKLHIGHVLHVLDPALEADGPGLGYGLVKAARGVTKHIGLASISEDVSLNVQVHASHAGVSATNVIHWAEEALKLARRAKATTYRNTAQFNAGKIATLLGQIVDGVDADGDGTVSWDTDEGGLAQVEQHMAHMAEGEGLI